MTGVILAGGENKRMGSDKAFLTVEGKPIVERVLAAFGELFPSIIISTNSPHLYGSYGVDVVIDAVESRGPLTGIYSSMLHSHDSYYFVVACDMPFLNPELIAYMRDVADGYDAVAPRLRGMVEPLHAVYSRSLLPVMERLVRQGRQQIRLLFDHGRVRYIDDAEIKRFDPANKVFTNLNTPHEYKEAVCSDSGQGN